MVVRIISATKSIDANTANQTVLELTPPSDVKYKVLEIALAIDTGAYFDVFVGNRKICESIYGECLAIDNRRIVVDWEIVSHEPLKIIATNPTSSSVTAKVLIVYEETGARVT